MLPPGGGDQDDAISAGCKESDRATGEDGFVVRVSVEEDNRTIEAPPAGVFHRHSSGADLTQLQRLPSVAITSDRLSMPRPS